MDLFYPTLQAQVGRYVFARGITLTVCSAADAPCDWASIRFTSPMPEAVTLSAMEPARLLLGYADSLVPVFEGVVSRGFVLSGQSDELQLKDDAARLARTPIRQTFVNATPQEVVTACCRAAGITPRLGQRGYPQRTYPVPGGSALDAIRGINQHWGIAAPGYMQDGCYCWDVEPMQTELLVFEYAKNIVSLGRERDLWVLTTVSVPQLRHSQRIALLHPRLGGVFTVQRVVFTSREGGFIRTQIFFKA